MQPLIFVFQVSNYTGEFVWYRAPIICFFLNKLYWTTVLSFWRIDFINYLTKRNLYVWYNSNIMTVLVKKK